MNYILTFGSVHRVLKAEEILNDAGVGFRLLPAPKALEKSCDLVIFVDEDELSASKAALEAAGLLPRTIYRKDGQEYVAVGS